MKDSKIYQKIAKYLSGEIKESETENIELWLKSDKEIKKKFEESGALWQKISGTGESWNVDNAWEKVKTAMHDVQPTHAKNKVRINNSWSSGFQFARVSFAVIIIVVVSLIAMERFGLFNGNQGGSRLYSLTTDYGNIKKVVLGDGSVVTMNAASSIEIPADFGKEKRAVRLSGEAFFEVTANPNVPFIVHAGNVSATVLGTKFNVKAFPDETELAVSLVEGKVKVARNDTGHVRGEVILNPSEQIVFNDDSKNGIVSKFNRWETIGWKANILVFNNVELEKIFKVLERAYGVKFEIQNDLHKLIRISANFENESFWTVVKSLQSLTDLNYRTEKNADGLSKIIFYKK
ncbi:MAG: FecR domain-containing protein [Ignavibacteria bacterium]|jgi:ferric-dicitrate binding protein FerR (iron transport regulator)